MEICWLPKSKKIRIDCSQKETRLWRHDAMQQRTELNIVATDDQDDYKVGKLAKEQLSLLN